MTNLQQELRYAIEGLAQMQEPEAGYFEDWNHKQPHEIAKLEYDIHNQTVAIDRLEKKLARNQ